MSRQLEGRFWRSLGAPSWVVLLASGCSPSTSTTSAEPVGTWQGALTATFRSGASGYATVDDVYISSHYGGNGVTVANDNQIYAWTKTGADPYEAEALVRFNGLSLPTNSHVTSATLTLTFENWYTGFTLRGYYLKSAWNAAAGGPLGWLSRDAGVGWNTPGAKGQGTDVISGLSFSNADWSGNGEEVKTFELDPGVVQGWIDAPASNQGVVLVNNEASDKYLRIYTSEDPVVARRPLLTVDYTTGGSCATATTGEWFNTPIASQAATFTAELDARPSTANQDAVIGLALGAPHEYAGIAVAARFAPTGVIDARNGSAYDAVSSIPYMADTTYHFRLVVDVPAHSYSAYVRVGAGVEQTLATSYAFRTEQAAVSSLNDWVVSTESAGASTEVCNFGVTPGGGGGDGSGGSGGSGSGGSGAHPRIWLDATTLSNVRQRATAPGDPQWNALELVCDSYLPGTVTSSEGQCTSPNVCGGYKGEDYINPLMSEALCYQIGVATGETNALAWGNKGVAILIAMAQHTAYDDGEAIRNYGIGEALGYDWLYPLLTPALKSTLHDRINGRIEEYESNSWSRLHPHGNYYAGYYAAKAYAALATEASDTNSDNPSAPAHWTSFLDLQRGGPSTIGSHTGVAAYYTSYMNGNVWSEGWQYGGNGARNMSLPALAAKTAKNVDLIADPTAPYRYPLENALPLMHATWPSRDYMDDRDTVRGVSTGSCPTIIGNAKPSPFALAVTHTMLTRWNAPLAPAFHSWAKAVRSLVGTAPAWAELVFWNDAAPDADFNLQPRAYSAANYAAMRSDWGTGATWGSLRASGYVDNPDAAEQYPDAGALAIVRGRTPFLVNPAFLHRCYGSTDASWDQPMHDEYIGGPSEMFNTFYNGPANGTAGQYYGAAIAVDKSAPPLTRISAFEDGNGYVFLRAVDLEDTYRPGSNITSWGRDVVYLRSPGVFVVYDSTQVANTAGDQHMNWHFPPLPKPVAASGGARRYDVQDDIGGFKGAITTVLPANATIGEPESVFGASKLYRLEVRPATPAPTMRWLTVLDPATSTQNVLPASLISSSTNLHGVLLTSSSGNEAVLFGDAAGQILTPPISFSVTAAATTVVVTDLAASTSYTIGVSTSGGNHTVTIQPGPGISTSAKGVLYFDLSVAGGVTAGS